MTPTPEENRRRWVRDLSACLQWHKEQAEKSKSPILGAEPTDDSILHSVFHNAVLDALIVVENLALVDADEEVEVIVDNNRGRAKNITADVKEENEDTSNS